MKGGRWSNRVASSEPADDWVDGSWTVDCMCGVNFDDGEEMVNCDECGVWVHTRCSRFVKGAKSFACDKCKNKNSNSSSSSEETEVAQLLVDLPTKTITPPPSHFHSNNNKVTTTTVPPHRLWAQRPLPDPVHVQGVPGGSDPSLFQGFPLLFPSQLWKCSGYIPKKFNFRYNDFPCWDHDIDPPATPNLVDKPSSPKPTSKRSRDGSTLNKKLKRDTPLPSPHTVVKHERLVVEVNENKGVKLPQSISIAAADPSIKTDAPITHNTPSLPTTSSPLSTLAPPPHISDMPAPPQLHAPPLPTLPSSNKDAPPCKTEGLVLVVNNSNGVHFESPTSTSVLMKPKPPVEHTANGASERRNAEIRSNLEVVTPSASELLKSETNSDLKIGNSKVVQASPLADIEAKADNVKSLVERVLSPIKECEKSESNEDLASTSQSLELEGQENDKGLEAGSGCQLDINDKLEDNPCTSKLKCEGSMKVQKASSETKEVAIVAGQTSKLSGEIPPPSPNHDKTVSVGKPSVSTPAIVFSRSSLSDKSKGNSQNSSSVGRRLMSNSSVKSKKDDTTVSSAKKEEKYDRPKSMLKDHPKSGANSSVKPSQPSRTVSGPVLKHYTSVGKDSLKHLSSKVSAVERVESSSLSSGVNKPARALHTEQPLHGQNRNAASVGLQRGEKVAESNLQPPSKLSQSSVGLPPASTNSPAGLSDEELALLLHQQLNSSPRVTRVPRVRQAGSLPQLASAAAANMLTKRNAGSGVKDHYTFSRRKSKDLPKGGSRSSRDQDSEARKSDRVPPSPDPVKKSVARTEGNSDSSHALRTNSEKSASSAANSGSFSADADELKSSSLRLDTLDDDTGTTKGPGATYRTLPGLIAEIMGSGRRMTYEELCNAVLPHWQNLRKHNGERYAYSSHSQAVLDCLRNRTEWARLVDRGPKASGTRKKRKVDAEPPNTESEDGESKSFESNQEEYPKGRRKVRKGRKLALQGRGVKDGQKRRKVVVESDDSGSCSGSSEDSISSEDDSEGSGVDAAKSEVSASSH